MNSYQAIVDFNLKIAPVMVEINRPLYDCFQIQMINHRRIYKTGSMLFLCAREDWRSFVLENEVWISNKFIDLAPDTCQQPSVYNFWEYNTKKSDSFFVNGYKKYNIWNGLSVYKDCGAYIETYAFAGTLEQPGLLCFYLSNIDIIEHFILYFREKISPFLKNVPPAVMIPFPIGHLLQETAHSKMVLKEFMEQFQAKEYYMSVKGAMYKLSRRELECLLPLVKGLTAKEIARDLQLSPRSVESYLENLRTKLECHSRGEMIGHLISSKDFQTFMAI